MPDTKISALADGAALQPSDLFVIARAGGNFKVVAPSLDVLSSIHSVGGDVSLNLHKLTNVATPTSSGDAATKGYVDGLAGVGTPTLGAVLIAGADAGGVVVTNLGDPVLEQDAATKNYVDSADINDVIASTYTPAIGDVGGTIVMEAATATLTLPTNAAVPIPVRSVIYVRAGTGATSVTIAGAAGVTLVNPYNSFVLAAANAEVKCLKIGTNVWSVNGEVA